MSFPSQHLPKIIIGGSTIIGLPLGSSILYSLYVYSNTPKHQISELHTFKSIYVQSFTNLFMTKLAQISNDKLEASCKNARSVNERLLLKTIIHRNKDTKYGIDHNLSQIRTREDFRVLHPITRHDHYEPYINQIIQPQPGVEKLDLDDRKNYDSQDGSNIMFPDRPRMIAETSGTSGTRKLIPVPSLQRKVFFTDGIGVTFHALMKGVGRENSTEISGAGTAGETPNTACSWPSLQKSCKLMIEPKYTFTNHDNPDNKLKIGPNSSSPKDNKLLLQLYTTPPLAFDIQNENTIMFIHALYALLDRNLGFIESNFANRVFNFFVLIEDRWEELLHAIEFGKLPKKEMVSSTVGNNDDDNDEDMYEYVRQQLEKELQPNPTRANELRKIKADYDRHQLSCDSNPYSPSFARRIWPSLHTVLAAETGAFQIYGDKLRKNWIGYNDKITIYSPLYAASEGLIGVNPNVKDKTYVLNPNSMFFEFIPIASTDEKKRKNINEIFDEKTSDQKETLFIEELEIGKEYELIITTLTGLYRYEFGDVIRCVGYKGEAPIVEFAYRKGQFLNVSGERTSEETFYNAISKTAQDDWKVELREYTCVDYFNLQKKGRDRKPKYTVFVEVSQKEIPLNKNEVNMLDKKLQEENELYGVLRKMGRLECIEVITVKTGTFEELKRKMIKRGIGATQIKQPRVTRNPELIKILEDGSII